MRLTIPQWRALRFLQDKRYALPSAIGEAILVGREHRKSRAAQGYGRVGGRVAANLIKLGLIVDAASLRDGFSAYAITEKGRDVLREIRESQS